MHHIWRTIAPVTAVLIAVTACGDDDDGEAETMNTEPGIHSEVALGERSYDIYLPASYDPAQQMPAMIALHGMPSNPIGIRTSSNMDAMAEEAGFIAVYPAGETGRWAASAGSDDVTFLRDLIGELVGSWHADPERIYMSGWSNGGDMTLVAATELPDLLAGAAPVTPSGTGSVTEVLAGAQTAVPMMMFLGQTDGRIEIGRNLADSWRDGTGCGDADTVEADGLTTVTYVCDNDIPMVVHEVHDQGHVWFGDQTNRTRPLWASEAMWTFFSGR